MEVRIGFGVTKWWLAALTVALAAMVSCGPEPARNFPPDNTEVRLDSTNLPIVWIEVGGDSIMRSERIEARMKIIHNGEGHLNYADTAAHPGQRVDYEGLIALRHRGNSTYNDSPKKPYSFRTLQEPLKRGGKKQKVSILEMPKDNNWALLAPYADKSMIRDMLALEIARPWMEFTPLGRHCELIVDGTYYGVYVLTEVVSKGKNRLNLYHPVDSNGKPFEDCIIHFQYKEPDPEDLRPEQRQYIEHQIDLMEAALASPGYRDPVNGYRRYLDMMSFIDYQLVMEVSHNVDAYRLSGKFFKRRDSVDPRFKMVVWDANMAFGNYRAREGWRTDTWMYRSNDVMRQEGEDYLIPFWWQRLNEDPAYTAALRQRWAEYRRTNLSDERLMATVDSLATVLTSHGAEQRNSQAWPRWGVWVWNNYYVGNNYADEIAFLKTWLKERIAWMDRQLGYHP